MPIFEVTAPDGRSLEIEGEKAPSLDELNEIFSSIPVAEKVSTNQSALKNIKSTDDEPEVGASIADRFNKLQKDSEQYLTNLPRKEEGMSWIEYAKLRKKYDEDWGIESFELNPLKHMWKTSVVGITSKVASDLHRKQKEVRAKKYTDNTEVLSEIPEEAYQEWDEKGEIKAGEAFMRSDWAKAVPFFGSVEGLNETFDIKSIVDKKNKGEELSKKEIERLNAYILDVAEQNRRGISFGGKLIQGALELPSFAGEFMATGGVASIGKTAVQKTITKGLQDATQKEIGKRLTKGLIETAAGATTRVSIGMPQRVADNYGMRKLHDSLGITDKGQVVLETADEAPALTFMKAWGDTVIEAWSEEMGGGLAEAAGLGAKTVSKFTSPVAEKLFSRNTRAAFIKAMRKMRPNATVKDVMTRAGFNGILGEMGEERAGDVLRVVFGIDDREDISTFDKLCEAIAPDKEELLLELGLFSIPSSMSFAASRVAGHLRKQNVKEEDISDYMRLTSELEKEKFLGDIAEKHDLEAIEKFEENVRTLKNRYYTQNLNAGIEKEEALATAEIEANAVSSLAKNIGMDINELNEEFAINLQSMTTEEAKAQREQDIKVLQGGVEMEVEADMPKFQSAMYKAPQENFADFYNQVFIKEQESKENNTVIKKSYFEYKNDDIQVRVKHDAINHTENKHQLTSDEWNNVLENLTNIEKAEISKETFSNDKVALVKINTPMGKYGVAIQFANGKNYIATAFKSTDKGINAWMKKSSAKTLSNNPIATLEDKSSESDVILGQNSNNIINDVKAKLKPNQRIFYQTDSYSDIARQNIEANFGESIEDLTSMVRSDVENVLFENVIDESEFKIEKIRMNGSYTTGKNKKSSDLDFLLEYTGTMREDDAFNMFAEAKLEMIDYKGKRVKIDINPIKAEKSGTIADRLNAAGNIYYQSEDKIDNARGFTYQRFNFDGTTKDNLIVLLKNKSDKTTLLHEFAHVYLTTLNNLALRNDRAKELLLTVNKWLNYNGVEYTAKQHEKFANGFVAYVKAGKAPTYGLKRAFENFKRWLNDMYNELTLNDGIEFDDYTKEVFDELLGNSSNTAKNELIADLINRAKNNANLRIREEQISLNNKIKVNELTDSQRRYRDVACEILYSAAKNMKDEEGNPLVTNIRRMRGILGDFNKKKNKDAILHREKVINALLQADSVNGFKSHWGEFFDYLKIDNMETGADAELISQALAVITERRYLYASDSLFNPNEVTEEDLKKSKYELDYILEEYKYNKYERDLTVAAFFEWVDSVHPYIIDDIILEWENKTNEIDRYENLNEFQKAKEDLKIKAATLKGYGDYSTQFAEYAREIIKRLNFMTEHDKMKIFDKLKDYNSFREIERNLDSVMDYAETLNDVTLRKNLAETIIKEVKRTVPEKVNGTKKTKYDYRTNKLFERLRFLEKMSQEEIKNIYDAYVKDELERRTSQFNEAGTITGKTETFFEDIENSFIQFKANGIYYNSTEMLQTLLDKIQNAKFTGKIARDEADFKLRMEKENWINQCAQALESHRGNVGKLEELYSMEANLDSIMGMIFDDNIKNKFSLDDLYAQVDGRVGADREEVLNKIANVFEYQGILKGVKLNNKFIEMANEKYTIRQRYAKKEDTDSLGVWQWETIELSKMEILYYYIQAKNPTSYEMLTDMGTETRAPKGQFDRFEFNELLNNLSDQEKLVGDILQLAAEKYYNDLNKYHIRKHHIDMGKVNCYFPRKSELNEVNELDLFNQYTEKSTNPKFVKIRTAGPSIRIAPANPINVLFNHIQKANTIIIMGEQLDLINKVFRDNDLKQKITSVFGEKVYTEFMQHIAENLYSGQTKTLSNAEGILSKLMSNIIGAPMFIKPQVGIKQILGLINYGIGDEYVGTLEWGKAFRKVIKSPREAIDFMMQDEYLKDRLTRANMNEAMKKQIENKLNSRMSLLTDYFSLNMRLGDLLNLTLGGRAYIDVLLKKGYSKDQAFALFRKKTLSDQQSSIPSTLSNMQRNSKDNPFARLLFAYQNTPHQYFRICANAIIKLKQGKLDKKKAFKTIFVYWYLLPLIFNMAGSLSPITFLMTGDPSEIFTDMKISCLGSISCIPFFGEMARALFCGITGEDYFGNRDWFSRANNAIVKPIKKIKEGDLSLEDIIKSLEVFAQGAGIPLEEINTQIEAFGDYASGNYEEGFLKTLGYSRYRAKTVTGNN